MYRLLLYFPLARALRRGLGGRFLGSRGRRTLRTSCLRLTRRTGWVRFYEIGIAGVPVVLPLRTWFRRDPFEVHWSVSVDRLSVVMVCLVSTVSTLVHLYSSEYLRKDPHLPRFFSYLAFFTFTMLVLVTRRDLVQIFFGWEGVGVASYLLIQFWYRRSSRNVGANKAMLYNRRGDLALALGIWMAYSLVGSVDIAALASGAAVLNDASLVVGPFTMSRTSAARLCLLIGAMGKSAQLGLHPWLPDAMEGPTPVSALIHAATMVTAGVYLLIRCSFLRTETSLLVVRIVGALTSLFAVSVGSGQFDLKRMIAYSTCSQLGFMVFACGIGQYQRALFHLYTHGFYKRLLFLARGSVIHRMSDEQDLRRMGGRRTVLPHTTSALMVGSLALTGFPFRAGFYSKDLILETREGVPTLVAAPLALVASLRAYGTAYYSASILVAGFLGSPRRPKATVASAGEPGLAMSIPLALLSIARIGAGWFFEDLIAGMGTVFWQQSASFGFASEGLIAIEFTLWKVLPLLLSRLGRRFGTLRALHVTRTDPADPVVALITQKDRPTHIVRALGSAAHFLSARWGVDAVIHRSVVHGAIQSGWHTTYKAVDQGLLEYLSPYASVRRSEAGSAASTALASPRSNLSSLGQWVGLMYVAFLGRTVLFVLVMRPWTLRIGGVGMTFLLACWYAPFWIHGSLTFGPLDRLVLPTQTESMTFKRILWLTCGLNRPFLIYVMPIRTHSWTSFLVIGILGFHGMLWRRELARDLSMETDLMYAHSSQPLGARRVLALDVSPSRLEWRALGAFGLALICPSIQVSFRTLLRLGMIGWVAPIHRLVLRLYALLVHLRAPNEINVRCTSRLAFSLP